MMQVVSHQLPEPAQHTRLREFSAEASVDIHCHCLPGLDDGPATMQQALQLCRALVADGVTHAIATPHQLGNYTGTNSRNLILESVIALREQIDQHGIPLKIDPGGDVRIDPSILSLLDRDEILTLADQKSYILLELPHEVLIDPRPLIAPLASRGISMIISHPERQAMIARKPEVVMPWVQAGALLQVTAGSLLGDFGPAANVAGWRLIESGVVAFIASDSHDVIARPPRMTQAIAALSQRLGHAVARRLCIENPQQLLAQNSARSA